MINRQFFATAIGDECALLDEALILLSAIDKPVELQLLNQLEKLNTSHGTNMATAVFYQYLLQHANHGPFIDQVRSTSPAATRPSTSPQLVIVPGMFAAEKPEFGGDGALLIDIAKSFGFTVSIAPTDGRASLAANAQVLHDYLMSRDDDNFWLVSISRGSADVKFLLHQFPDAPYHQYLRQWISVSGVVTGSPLVNRFANLRINSMVIRGLFRLSGVSADLADELDGTRAHWSNFPVNDSIRITHVAPVPLDWHVTTAVLPRYQRLKRLGPTDGVSLLPELLAQSGRIYPIWGADHMLRAPHLAEHFYRLINFLILEDEQ